MNLAAEYNAADVHLEDVKVRIEALLTGTFPKWQHWEFRKPDGIEVFGAYDSPRGAAILHARGFVTVTLHDHLPRERTVTCQCPVREQR